MRVTHQLFLSEIITTKHRNSFLYDTCRGTAFLLCFLRNIYIFLFFLILPNSLRMFNIMVARQYFVHLKWQLHSIKRTTKVKQTNNKKNSNNKKSIPTSTWEESSAFTFNFFPSLSVPIIIFFFLKKIRSFCATPTFSYTHFLSSISHVEMYFSFSFSSSSVFGYAFLFIFSR